MLQIQTGTEGHLFEPKEQFNESFESLKKNQITCLVNLAFLMCCKFLSH